MSTRPNSVSYIHYDDLSPSESCFDHLEGNFLTVPAGPPKPPTPTTPSGPPRPPGPNVPSFRRTTDRSLESIFPLPERHSYSSMTRITPSPALTIKSPRMNNMNNCSASSMHLARMGDEVHMSIVESSISSSSNYDSWSQPNTSETDSGRYTCDRFPHHRNKSMRTRYEERPRRSHTKVDVHERPRDVHERIIDVHERINDADARPRDVHERRRDVNERPRLEIVHNRFSSKNTSSSSFGARKFYTRQQIPVPPLPQSQEEGLYDSPSSSSKLPSSILHQSSASIFHPSTVSKSPLHRSPHHHQDLDDISHHRTPHQDHDSDHQTVDNDFNNIIKCSCSSTRTSTATNNSKALLRPKEIKSINESEYVRELWPNLICLTIACVVTVLLFLLITQMDWKFTPSPAQLVTVDPELSCGGRHKFG